MAQWLACWTLNRYDSGSVPPFVFTVTNFCDYLGLVKMTNVSLAVYGQDIYQHKLVILTNLFLSVDVDSGEALHV